jgi:hypothetical protein
MTALILATTALVAVWGAAKVVVLALSLGGRRS